MSALAVAITLIYSPFDLPLGNSSQPVLKDGLDIHFAMNDYWVFVSAVFVLLIAPGPTNALLAVGGSQRGFSRSLPLLFAELSGYAVAILIIHLVLQPLLIAFPAVSLMCKLFFAAFVFHLAFKLWRPSSVMGATTGVVSFRTLFVTTLLNPKAFGFALVLIPFEHPDLVLYLTLFSFFVLFTGALWVAAGAFATRAFGTVAEPILSRIAAISMCVFACVIVYVTLSGLR